ncbi:hypothetical protein Adu01nite_79530 [Paractinoplanes durhamensis]|uniref:Major facilitator superfamily (MFS) profile domain-containing protein n=2 Tax=Paractinoplanes durhamensis TaxID=113563 RepID=A0ABQ3Z9U1_9ACTN|nr:MFS transporter [Actinoplanes durhamensis]GIE06603.1 hypothetical protein Adu01nite_79530 [Actinoplanes durhamensis]
MWHHRGFRRLWAAATVDACGTWLLVMAVPVQVYAVTGSATSTGLALAVQALPAVLIGPWAGALTDRWPRRVVLVGANVAAALGVSILLVATSADRVGYVYLALAVENLAACFLRPALQAAIPAVVTDPADRASANALLATSHSALRICAPLAGTYLTAAGWFGAVVVVDVVSYLAAAAIIAGLPLPATTRPAGGALGRPDNPRPGAGTLDRPAGPHPGGTRLVDELRQGWRLVVHSRILAGLLAGSWLYWTANAALTALLVPFVVHRLDSSGQAVGYLVTGLGVGYLCGSAVSRTVLLRSPARTQLTISYALVGVCFLIMFSTSSLLVAVVAVTAAGLPGAVAGVATTHHVQNASPPWGRARVSATFMTSDATAAVIGALAAPALVAIAGLPTALITLSAAVLLAAATAAFLLPAESGPPT